MEITTRLIPLKDIEENKGQIKGLPKNPRFIKDEKFEKLKQSIADNPEMLSLRELLVYPVIEHTGPDKEDERTKYVIIGGNMRYRACKDLKMAEIPCKIIPISTTIEQLKAYTIKDNNGFGEWDFDLLANEWDDVLLKDWGVDIPDLDFDTDEIPADLDEEQMKDKPFTAKLTFKDATSLNDFQMMEFERLCKQYGCTISLSGGEL